jgi:hypothetical protein
MSVDVVLHGVVAVCSAGVLVLLVLRSGGRR